MDTVLVFLGHVVGEELCKVSCVGLALCWLGITPDVHSILSCPDTLPRTQGTVCGLGTPVDTYRMTLSLRLTAVINHIPTFTPTRLGCSLSSRVVVVCQRSATRIHTHTGLHVCLFSVVASLSWTVSQPLQCCCSVLSSPSAPACLLPEPFLPHSR